MRAASGEPVANQWEPVPTSARTGKNRREPVRTGADRRNQIRNPKQTNSIERDNKTRRLSYLNHRRVHHATTRALYFWARLLSAPASWAQLLASPFARSLAGSSQPGCREPRAKLERQRSFGRREASATGSGHRWLMRPHTSTHERLRRTRMAKKGLARANVLSGAQNRAYQNTWLETLGHYKRVLRAHVRFETIEASMVFRNAMIKQH